MHGGPPPPTIAPGSRPSALMLGLLVRPLGGGTGRGQASPLSSLSHAFPSELPFLSGTCFRGPVFGTMQPS